MDLEIFRDYLAFLSRSEFQLNNHRTALSQHSPFAFYKLIAPKSQSTLDSSLMTTFIKSFTYNFQPSEPQNLMSSPSFTLYPKDERPNQLQLMEKGIDLFLNKWGNDGKLDF